MSDKASGWRTVKIGFYGLGFLLLLEMGLRVLFSFDPVLHKLRGNDASSARLQWINRHASQQESVYKFDAYSPSRGWSVEPNVKNMVVFKDRVLNSNSKGMRGVTEYSYARQPGKRRILVFGDSYSFGDEVSDDETFSHYLEQILPDTEVLNFGVHGYGQDQMLRYLQEEGVKYQPDIVILGYIWYDRNRNMFDFTVFSKPKYEMQGRELRVTNVPVPSPEWFLENEFYRLKILDLGVILREKFLWVIGVNHERAKALTATILTEFARTARQVNATPVFVYLPVLDELANLNEAMTQHEQYLFEYCEKQQISCLFPRALFIEAAKNGMIFDTQRHWRAEGHMIAAKGIGDFLLHQQLLVLAHD